MFHCNFNNLHRGEAVLRKHLQRRLRTFEENQISKIIRRTKCKITLLKFHQFYSAKKYPLRFFNNHSVAKFQKKLKGNPLESLKNFRKKKQKMRFFNSLSAEKS